MDQTQSGSRYGQPDIRGSWADGLDKSRNRLQLVPTAEPGKIAMRSTGAEDVVLTTTPAQLVSLAESIREGRFDHVIKQTS